MLGGKGRVGVVRQTFRVAPCLYLLIPCFHDLSRPRVPIDRSLTYPFVTHIPSLVMHIFDQFISFDVIPSHAQPYGYSMGPQATIHAISSNTASTAAAKEQNNDRTPFVVVVLCTSFFQTRLCRYWKTVTDKLKTVGAMVLTFLFGCLFYLLCRNHFRGYIQASQTKLPSSPAPTHAASTEPNPFNASTSGRGLLRDIEKALRRTSRDASQPIDAQEKHNIVKLPSDVEIGVVQNAERVRPTRAVATVLRGMRVVRPSPLRTSHVCETDPEPSIPMNRFSRFMRLPRRSQTAPALSPKANVVNSHTIQVNNPHLPPPVNLPVSSPPSPSSVSPPPMYSTTQGVPPYTVRVVPPQSHRSASTPVLSPSLSSRRTSVDSAQKSPTLFYNQHGVVQVPAITIQACTPPGVSDLVQAVEEMGRGGQNQPAEQTMRREGILAVHREESYSWDQSHPPTLDFQVPTSKVQQSPSAGSATSMRRAVLAASQPKWI